jgi:hypothetical protein
MAAMLEAMPHLCDLEPPRSEQKKPDPEEAAMLQRYEAVKPYSDKIWGPASWTALEADILSLPERLDAHEYCLFKIYLALRARYLSCSACAMHFEKALKAMPNDAIHRTRAGLLRWLCGVHNEVNKRKQRQPLAEDEILAILNGKAAVPDHDDEEEAGGEPEKQGGAPSAAKEHNGATYKEHHGATYKEHPGAREKRSDAAAKHVSGGAALRKSPTSFAAGAAPERLSLGMSIAALAVLAALALLAASASGVLKWSWWPAKLTPKGMPKGMPRSSA